ncbi:hypothetical protein HY623_01030 [Candidatus Uhrbacteria bacterium]|nr:hypothetical protein [Candidatus Uhrbacteria bacterium]
MDERKLLLVTHVVDAYISTAHPVGSQVLASRYRLSWSSATIRNVLSHLEEEGYMFQPYTSAGRVPTHLGYRLYLEHVHVARLNPALERSLSSMAEQMASFDELRELCRILSRLTQEVVFTVTRLGSFTTGTRFITRKPEAEDPAFMRDITNAIDALEDICAALETEIGSITQCIGDGQTFGGACSVLLVRVPFQRSTVMIGILGPLRMNYHKNIALLQSLIPKP